MPEKEKIPMLLIYKQNGEINADLNKNDIFIYELFGFLKCYIKVLEEELLEMIEQKGDKK